MIKKSKNRFKRIKFKKELNKEIIDIERWVHERRKFLIKLTWIISLIVILVIISNLYLKVKGIGF